MVSNAFLTFPVEETFLDLHKLRLIREFTVIPVTNKEMKGDLSSGLIQYHSFLLTDKRLFSRN